ncbi:CPBP family intramembrane metalloprotease [Candidatus Peregrinibacteria bacterium]|nr:CPBP family intramembrane metalloprotease [Candidatus Peregrinibacteria bacterium]
MKKYWQASLGFNKIKPLKALGIAVVAYIFYLAVNIFILITLLYFNWKIPGYELQPSIIKLFGNGTINVIGAGIISILVTPILEEIFFRGFLLRILCNKLGIIIGSLITAVAFGFLHFPWQAIIPSFVFGLILNAIVIRSRSIWPAIAFHILNNAIVFAFLLLIEKRLAGSIIL